MKLMTEEILKQLPKLYSTENVPLEEKIAVVKYFNPCGPATWYGIEYDPEEKLFFGYADLFGDETCAEYGMFSLTELENINLPFGLKIERDLHFTPKPMKEVLKNMY